MIGAISDGDFSNIFQSQNKIHLMTCHNLAKYHLNINNNRNRIDCYIYNNNL